ncbi:MAG: 4-hydroxybenzoate octaprenyltransferase [Xanthomonadales bacterium]|nr:4-hydroxybenzoate octaprenyltransferase [Xanthomonadales bacterium]
MPASRAKLCRPSLVRVHVSNLQRPAHRVEFTAQGARIVSGDQSAPRPSKLSAWLRLVRADKPIGILLLLWPTLWALWLAAGGLPPLATLAIFVAGVVLTRSGGCVINDYADRWLDPNVQRTQQRPLATGEISGTEGLIGFALIMLIAFGLVLLTNQLTIYLSLGALALAVFYPYSKRLIWFPQVILGAAFSMAIPMAFAAVSGEVPQLAWLLFCANILWTTAYDTLYAMVDRDDDLEMGARSTAILFGDLDRVAVGILQGSFLLAMLLLGRRAELGTVYFASLVLAALLIAYQLWLARNQEREPCFQAFLHNNWVGLIVFAGIATSYWVGR